MSHVFVHKDITVIDLAVPQQDVFTLVSYPLSLGYTHVQLYLNVVLCFELTGSNQLNFV